MMLPGFFSKFLVVAILVGAAGLPQPSSAETANKVTKILFREIEIQDAARRKAPFYVSRASLNGQTIDILEIVDGGDRFLVNIPGLPEPGKYLIYAEDVDTDIDEAFYKACREKTADALSSNAGTGRGAGTVCN